MKITAEGAVLDNPEEIREKLMDEVKAKIPSFLGLPAELQTNLIDSSVIICSHFDSALVDLFNSIAPYYANDLMLTQFGESFGIKRIKKQAANISLTFSGEAGAIIPKGTIVQNMEGKQVFETDDDAVILGNGEALVHATSVDDITDIIPKDTINQMVSEIVNVRAVTNKTEGAQTIMAETTEEYRKRVQRGMRGNKMGSIDYAEERLLALKGVIGRMVSFKYTTKKVGETITASVNAVVGGGDDYEVAFALFSSFVSPLLFTSDPSDGDTNRTTTIELNLNGVDFNVMFTRPKTREVSISANIKVIAGTLPVAEGVIKDVLYGNLSKYINNLRVGTSISLYTIEKYIFDTLDEMGYKPNIIQNMTFTVQIDGADAEITENMIEAKLDEAFTLSDITITKVG